MLCVVASWRLGGVSAWSRWGLGFCWHVSGTPGRQRRALHAGAGLGGSREGRPSEAGQAIQIRIQIQARGVFSNDGFRLAAWWRVLCAYASLELGGGGHPGCGSRPGSGSGSLCARWIQIRIRVWVLGHLRKTYIPARVGLPPVLEFFTGRIAVSQRGGGGSIDAMTAVYYIVLLPIILITHS